jgi:metal-responsive CopG/Arc/MetJ family transcriptional regulator
VNDGTKVLSLRLANELAAEVANVARVEDVTISETIRAALYRYITTRRTEEDFKKRLRRRLEQDREELERLGE